MVKKLMKYGIQGGLGSFNEEALSYYASEKNLPIFETIYLFTTENVLSALKKNSIDFGVFAINNSVGGIVDESIEAMAKYTFKIVYKFGIPIQHFLMKRKDIDQNQISEIMAHPQVLLQCKKNLKYHYANMRLSSGEGNLIDTAECAKSLSEGKLPKNIAILGPRRLSSIYNLEIIDENLQDDKTNITDFLIVSR